jgi:hypothetical protein
LAEGNSLRLNYSFLKGFSFANEKRKVFFRSKKEEPFELVKKKQLLFPERKETSPYSLLPKPSAFGEKEETSPFFSFFLVITNEREKVFRCVNSAERFGSFESITQRSEDVKRRSIYRRSYSRSR